MSLYVAVLGPTHERVDHLASLLECAGVEVELVATTDELPSPTAFDGVFALGGGIAAAEASLLDPAMRFCKEIVHGGIPYLGVGLGAQLLALALDARVYRSVSRAGLHEVFLTDAAHHDPLFAGFADRLDVFGVQRVNFDLPSEAVLLAHSAGCRPEAFRYGAVAYGFQFHLNGPPGDFENFPEVEEPAPGLGRLPDQLLERWLYLVSAVAALRATA